MISMQVLEGALVALAGLVSAAIALTIVIMTVPRVSYPGQAPRGDSGPGGGSGPGGDRRPDLSPEPEFVVPDDARELTEDRELALV